MANDIYYLGITTNYEVLESRIFSDLKMRNDVEHYFMATYKRSTSKNAFYEISHIDKEENPLKYQTITLKGINVRFRSGEKWEIFKKKDIKGKVLCFEVTDLLGLTIFEYFHCYPHHTSGLENLLIYCEHLSRLGTHQAVSEVFNLKEEIEKLNKKIDNLKKRKLN